jgi:general secretion pathway protein L
MAFGNLRLLVRIKPNDDIDWVLLDAQGGIIGEVQTGTPIASAVKSVDQIIALVPSESIWMGSARIPAKSQSQRRKAAPYAVEDQIADSIEQLHFAIDAEENEQTRIVAVKKSAMQSWLACLQRHQIYPDVILPDALLLPQRVGEHTFLLEAERALIRQERHRGFATSIDNLALWIKHAAAARGLNLYRIGSVQFDLNSDDIVHNETSTHALRIHALALRAESPVINLMQGEYKPRARGVGTEKLWRYAAILLVATIVSGILLSKFDQIQKRQQLNALRGAINQVFVAAMPDGAKPVPGRERAQMEAALAGIQSGTESGLFGQLAEVGSVLANRPQFRLDTVSYQDGVLELDLLAPDMVGLESLRDSIAQKQSAQLEQVSRAEGGMRARLRVGAKVP